MDNEIALNRRIDALYVQDDRGRMVAINEPDPQHDPPRLYILRTASHCLWRIRHDVPDKTASQLETVLKDEAPSDRFMRAFAYQAYVDILEQDQAISDVSRGPAYHVPDLSAPSDEAILINDDNKALLAEHFPYTLESYTALNPIAVMVADDCAVAACFCSRKTPYLAEAGVYTIDDYRKQGFAKAVVQSWAYAVQAIGLRAVYSTSWDNIASQRIASSVGAVQYGVDFSIG